MENPAAAQAFPSLHPIEKGRAAIEGTPHALPGQARVVTSMALLVTHSLKAWSRGAAGRYKPGRHVERGVMTIKASGAGWAMGDAARGQEEAEHTAQLFLPSLWGGAGCKPLFFCKTSQSILSQTNVQGENLQKKSVLQGHFRYTKTQLPPPKNSQSPRESDWG